jgi:hypothetical protein
MDSPFRNLNLINPTPSDELTFRISIGEKPYLNEFLVLYTCLDFMILNDPGTKSATTTRLARDPGSPGRLLKLSEEDLLSYLEKSTFEVEGVTIASPAGSSQLIVEGSHHDLARKVLMKIYNRQINKSISDFVGSVMRSGLNQLTLDIPGRAS